MSTNALHEIEPTEKRPIWAYHATIPADVGAIKTVMDEVMDVGEQTECFKGRELEIETVLREALTNAVIHGCKTDQRQMVRLSVSCHEDREIEMVVRNPGNEFDPRLVPDPTAHQNLRATRGRGFFLIEQFMKSDLNVAALKSRW